MDIAIGPAGPEVLPAVRALLTDAGLPTAGAAEASFVVAKTPEGECVGCAAIEAYTDAVVRRSVAVAPRWQHRALGRRLVEAALRQACGRPAFLLTETAADFFARLRFQPIARTEADPAVRASVEFVSVCPDSAVCMRRDS